MKQMSDKPNCNMMALDKIDGGIIQVRKGFSELRADNVDQMEALDDMNTALYKLDQRVSDIRKVFMEAKK